MRDVVFLFPGQGSQYMGMGKDFYEGYPAVKRLFEEASDLIKKDFTTLCFEGPESTLVQTENVQPAITLVNLACLQVLREEGVVPSAAAGHSLGEYAALCAAGVFSFADTMILVRFRGTVMKEAADRHPGGMTAVFGLDMETLSAICGEVKETGSVEVANHNSTLQAVLTGEKEALQKAAELAKKKGAKLVVPLKVSGPWHSRFMTEAKERMKEILQECPLARPSFPVLSNVTADVYPDDPNRIREGLVEQIVRPVLWTSSIGRLIQNGRRFFLEVGPGKVLSGLMRDINREAKVLNVQDMNSLAKLRAFRSE
ncbi:MAG TPA: ACP S-malonyltransferase [Candidatus Binatia bacterium]